MFYWNLTGITGTLHENQYTLLIISRSVLLRMRNISDTICRENQNTHFMFRNFFFPSAVYDIIAKHILQSGKPQMTWPMRIACYISKATNSHSEYVILIAFPLQQCLQVFTTVVHHTYITCLVHICCFPISVLSSWAVDSVPPSLFVLAPSLTLILLMWRIGWAPNSIPIYNQQDATLHSLFISGNCSACFGWYFHPSSGAHTTVPTAYGICHTITAICRYRGRVGTGLSVLWVAYATHSTLKPVPTLLR
jgi:hypothetical protein